MSLSWQPPRQAAGGGRAVAFACVLLILTAAGCGASTGICSHTASGVRSPSSPFTSAIPLGAAVRWDRVRDSPAYTRFFLSHYSWLTPENELKMDSLTPQPAVFNFRTADAIVDWALAHRKTVHGHVLVWGQQLPTWVSALDAPGVLTPTPLAVAQLMGGYIHAVLAHFRGRIPEWDVVNEAFNPDGSWQPNFWWRHLGPAYVEDAFRAARIIDPQAKLCYNDLGIELPGPHADAALALVRRLRREKLIDCVGMELHTTAPGPAERLFERQFRRFAATGAYVLVSELDVTLEGSSATETARPAAQARAYANVALACRRVPSCARVTTWGFTDATSWLGRAAQPLPFDARCRAKPAWIALRAALMR